MIPGTRAYYVTYLTMYLCIMFILSICPELLGVDPRAEYFRFPDAPGPRCAPVALRSPVA